MSGSNLVLKSIKNGVCTLRMNNPKKLNGWTESMIRELFQGMSVAAKDESVKVVVVTGSGRYYCAGVNLNEMIKIQHPQTLWELIYVTNKKTFDTFLDFPKPILIAANGPAIGASVTSATLCDGIIAAPTATFSTPFARLGVPPEGCSSVHFARLMGQADADKMLKQDWAPTAAEAKQIGLIADIAKAGVQSAGDVNEELENLAQQIGEEWIRTGKQRRIAGAPGTTVAEWQQYKEELKAVNDRESKTLASEFLSPKFLTAQYDFLSSKGKTGLAAVFYALVKTRFLWKFLLKQ